MPNLSIIPAAAVADNRLTDGAVRVLCAIGTFTDKLGGNVWASVNTLAKSSNLSIRSVQRSLGILEQCGYIRRRERPGRTNLYEVVLQRMGATAVAPGDDSSVTPPPPPVAPKRPIERPEHNEFAHRVMREVWTIYPERDTPHAWVPSMKAIASALADGATPDDLVRAARSYRTHVERQGIEPKYVKGLVGFFRDGVWRTFLKVTVHGRTREEWARSGQDVAEFDRLAQETVHAA